ncbi:cilium assembly protein DZIP1 [Plutella xylostella]|uniref:cilium assembly protein DZIP1 n=1 Tax=Plutella xylostella TaxID=51655 RepID=UPI0020329143|nr:cilium assembly protein DZIP1 [Plutella xylostella]
MATKTSHDLHHNFAKLAEETGFVFNAHRPRVHLDWNKIRSIDVESLVKDRKFFVIEQNLNDIVDCVLESEFDVRILEPGVVKLFRLAQLALEYQQFCRRYLDRSVAVLRDQLTSVMQDLEAAKKDIRERDEEIRKLKRKSKHNFKPPQVFYGHDNIANMILKTLSHNGEMYPATSLLDSSHQYNKCNFCDKVFLNQLYLKSHMNRRHPNMMEHPEKDTDVKDQYSCNNNDHTKLNEEIMELRSKLQEMQTTITNLNNTHPTTPDFNNITSNVDNTNLVSEDIKGNGDAENTTAPDNTVLLEKIEEWKKEERDKYSKEMDLFRSQIFETINTMNQQKTENTIDHEKVLIQQLNSTIQEQGHQIHLLKEEISSKILEAERDKMNKSNEFEAQILQWMQKVETQTKQYQQMVDTLNQVTKEAQEARAQAEAERGRAARLQAMLEERQKKPETQAQNHRVEKHDDSKTTDDQHKSRSKSNKRSSWMSESKSLEELHQKAQALLNMKSSSSDDISDSNYSSSPKKVITKKPINDVRQKEIRVKYDHSADEEDISQEENIRQADFKPAKPLKLDPKVKKQSKIRVKYDHSEDEEAQEENIREADFKPAKPLKFDAKVKKQPKILKDKVDTIISKKNGLTVHHSPIRVIRAKLNEELNQRLALAGVDPLKGGVSNKEFNKLQKKLMQEQRLKIKNNPAYEKTRNSILAYLDTRAAAENEEHKSKYLTPTKSPKTFSLSSVMTNVKKKALSLVKHSDVSRENRLSMSEVTKRAIAILKTPPDSAQTSPVNKRRSPEKVIERNPKTSHFDRKVLATKASANKPERSDKLNTTMRQVVEVSISEESEDDSDTSESDHKYYDSTFLTKGSKSIDNLIKSPARRPATASGDYNEKLTTVKESSVDLSRTQSDPNILEVKDDKIYSNKLLSPYKSDIATKAVESPLKNQSILDAPKSPKQAKGVLKNAPSTSSLNKKKVLFDMDAIQTKSISASPSQSTEKSDTNENEKYELGLINLDDEEWDISSIDNEPLKKLHEETKINVISRATPSPKIAELKQTIESQLARRNETPSTMLVGGVDVLRGPRGKPASLGGSNTSLGSSVFDITDEAVIQVKTTTKTKQDHKDDSDLDISEFSIDDGIVNNKKRDSF